MRELFGHFPEVGKTARLSFSAASEGEGSGGGLTARVGWRAGGFSAALTADYAHLGQFAFAEGAEEAWREAGRFDGHQAGAGFSARWSQGFWSVAAGCSGLYRAISDLNFLLVSPALLLASDFDALHCRMGASYDDGALLFETGISVDCYAGGLLLEPGAAFEWAGFPSAALSLSLWTFDRSLAISGSWRHGWENEWLRPLELRIFKHWSGFSAAFTFEPAWNVAGKWQAEAAWEW